MHAKEVVGMYIKKTLHKVIALVITSTLITGVLVARSALAQQGRDTSNDKHLTVARLGDVFWPGVSLESELPEPTSSQGRASALVPANGGSGEIVTTSYVCAVVMKGSECEPLKLTYRDGVLLWVTLELSQDKGYTESDAFNWIDHNYFNLDQEKLVYTGGDEYSAYYNLTSDDPKSEVQLCVTNTLRLGASGVGSGGQIIISLVDLSRL